MYNELWEYAFHKNWNKTLTSDMLKSNVFCYGKPGSGKTSCVAIPEILNALNKGRSCIIFSGKPWEYKDAAQIAMNAGYVNIDWYLDSITDEKAAISQIMGKLEDGPLFLNAFTFRFWEPYSALPLENLLDEIYDSITSSDRAELLSFDKPLLIVLDGVCGNMQLCHFWLTTLKIQFCIIMGSEIASPIWRKQLFQEYFRNEDTRMSKERFTRLRHKLSDKGLAEGMLSILFMFIECVLCTGINGVKPEDHRYFINNIVMKKAGFPVGGKFAITELTELHTGREGLVIMPVERTDDIESNYVYTNIADWRIHEENWIVEINNKPFLVNFGNGIYLPVAHTSSLKAIKWVHTLIKQYDLEVISADITNEYECYELHSPEWNMDLELATFPIPKKDVEKYQLNYFLMSLELMDFQDFLLSPESKKYNMNCNSVTADAMLYEYYSKVIRPLEKKETLDETAEKEEPAEESFEPTFIWRAEDCIPEQEEEELQIAPSLEIMLPEEDVLFLGGHQNMTKKLKQIFPNWDFLTDDYIRRWNRFNHSVVFYWTGHSSHLMMQYVNSRLTKKAAFLYVTATNIERLVAEMQERYSEYIQSQKENGDE